MPGSGSEVISKIVFGKAYTIIYICTVYKVFTVFAWSSEAFLSTLKSNVHEVYKRWLVTLILWLRSIVQLIT